MAEPEKHAMRVKYLVGMGPGHPNCVTREAISCLQTVDRNVAFGRIAETARHFTDNVETVHRLEQVMECIRENRQSAILASGDACFFGILDYLKRKQVKIGRVVPGIASFQYMMAKLQIDWHDAGFFSLHGRLQDIAEIPGHRLAVILTDQYHTPNDISLRLLELGARGTIHAGFDLSYESERIVQVPVGDRVAEVSGLSTVVVEMQGGTPSVKS